MVSGRKLTVQWYFHERPHPINLQLGRQTYIWPLLDVEMKIPLLSVSQ